MGEFITQLVALMQAHKWLPVAALVIGALVRFAKSDVPIPFWNVPAKYRTWLAMGLGVVYGVFQSVIGGTPLVTALLQGLAAAMMAIVGHEAIVEGVRGGRDIGVSKSSMAARAEKDLVAQRGAVPFHVIAAVAAAVLGIAAVIVQLHGCAAAQTGCGIVHVLDYACDVFMLKLPDGRIVRVGRPELEQAGAMTAARLAASADGGAE